MVGQAGRGARLFDSGPAALKPQQSKGIKVGTTDPETGRRGDACADQLSETASILANARRIFAGLAAALEAELDRLQFAEEHERDDDRLAIVADLIKRNEKALQSVVDIRIRLLKQLDVRDLRTELIDLDEARAEIARRLARLAA